MATAQRRAGNERTWLDLAVEDCRRRGRCRGGSAARRWSSGTRVRSGGSAYASDGTSGWRACTRDLARSRSRSQPTRNDVDETVVRHSYRPP